MPSRACVSRLLGPCFGMKGGAAGGGYAQVVPMTDINLHFTGDFHAITSANNLLAALVDNHIYWGNALGIDPRRVSWRRALDMNDRALRQIVSSLGGVFNGYPREDGFDITVASEVMAIVCLSRDLEDLQRRLANIIVGTTRRPQAGSRGRSGCGQRRMAVALEWLANQGVGTWLTAGVLPLVDRYPTWQLTVPEYVDALSPDVPAEQSRQLGYPPLAGMPHPASAAEQRLESALARTEWAAGRTWNQQYVGHSLAPPIRVDLMWPAELCAVEIDGPDHRGSLKYAADRRRDNGLTLDGFAVLRFTNEEILDDHRQVLAVIESLLSTKRHDEGNLT